MHAGTVAPDQTEFTLLTDRYRTELLAHCYRMLGSAHEAEDLVQETYLRAWRAYRSFEGRSSIRTYLYRIATNACLTALRRRPRRVMPASVAANAAEPDWLEPIPDTWLVGGTDPAEVTETRAGVRLAFVAALQHLPPVRRAVLILRDVLSMPAAQAAEVLETTTAAVNSALLRARAQMARVSPVIDEVSEPPEPHLRALLDRYVTAFENADIPALVELLRTDVVLEMPPLTEWFRGRAGVVEFFATWVLCEPGRFRMVRTSANRQPALLAYQTDSGPHDAPHAVHVLGLGTAGVAHIAVFLDPATCHLLTRGVR